MFPPRNRYNLRLIRARALFFIGNKRKGLYAVLTIAIVCCVILAFNTMREQHDMELQDVVDDERRRMAYGARPKSKIPPLPPLSTTPIDNGHYDDWVGIMILPFEASPNIYTPLQWILYMKGTPPGVVGNAQFSYKETSVDGKEIGKMVPSALFHSYFVPFMRPFDVAAQAGQIPELQVSYLMLNSQDWKYEWVNEQTGDRANEAKYVLWSFGYRVTWTPDRSDSSSSTATRPQSNLIPPLPLPLIDPRKYQVSDDWTGIMIVPFERSTNIEVPMKWNLYMRGIPPGVQLPDTPPALRAGVTGVSGEPLDPDDPENSKCVI